MNIKVDFDNIIVKEEKSDTLVKVLMLKGEKGEAGATNWGAITGTLSNQTDLKNALDGKANQSDFNTVSGQVNANTSNISTINGQITDINGELDDFEDLFYGNATVNDENTSITLDNTVEAGFESFDLKGNTSQEGTPTPSSPIPVNVVSGDNSVNIYDKNLFDGEIELGSINPADGTLSSNTGRTRSKNFIKVQPNTTYTLTRQDGVNRWVIGYTKNKIGITDGNWNNYASAIMSIGSTVQSMTFTTTATTEYIKWYDTSSINLQEKVMIEKGTTASPFEPFSNTYNIDLPEGMELCKIGNYQDYIYKDSDKWYLHKEIGKKVLNGTETWILQSTKTSGYNRFRVEIGDNLVNTSSSNVLPMYCNKLSAISPDGTFLRTQGIASDSNANHYFNVYIEDTSTYTLANFKTWLGTNNLEVHYILSTPTNTEITYQPLIDQLNELEKAQSKENQTNISQVNNDLPFIIYAEAFANTFNGRMEGMNYKIENCEVLENKVTSITSGSTDSEYPSAKAVYDLFNSITDGDEVSY